MLKVGIHHKSYLHILRFKVRADANLTFDL